MPYPQPRDPFWKRLFNLVPSDLRDQNPRRQEKESRIGWQIRVFILPAIGVPVSAVYVIMRLTPRAEIWSSPIWSDILIAVLIVMVIGSIALAVIDYRNRS